MTESIWIAVIQFTVSPIILLLIAKFLNRRIQETKNEITNSHKTHLRDDLDNKFNLVLARQDTIIDELKDVNDKVTINRAHLDKELNTVYGVLTDHEGRLTGQARKLRIIAPRKK